MKNKMIYPFSVIDGKIIPDPESFILIMISRYRDSDYSDKELAHYISKGLSVTLNMYNAHIDQYHMGEGITFKSNRIRSNQTSKLRRLLKALKLKL